MSLRLSGGRRLQSPPGAIARPTAARVRQAVLNLLAPDLPGCRWLDLCCGSAVMACEVLQRGAAVVVALERDRRVAAVARANLEAVAAGIAPPRPRVRVVQADAGRWLAAHAPGGSPAAGSAAASDPAAGLRLSPVGDAVPGQERSADREAPFDLIYLDPPWPAGLHGSLSAAVAKGGWIQPEGTLVWECPSDQVPDVPAGWRLRDERRYGGSTLVLLAPL